MVTKGMKETFTGRALMLLIALALAGSTFLSSATIAFGENDVSEGAVGLGQGVREGSSTELVPDEEPSGATDLTVSETNKWVGESAPDFGRVEDGSQNIAGNPVDDGLQMDGCACLKAHDEEECTCDYCRGSQFTRTGNSSCVCGAQFTQKDVESPQSSLTVKSAVTTIHANEANSNAPLTKLGGFTISNDSGQDITDKRIKITFDSSIDVYAVNLVSGAKGGGRAYITYKEHSGTSYQNNDSLIVSQYPQSNAYFSFFATYRGPIATIEYNLGDFLDGYSTGDGNSELPISLSYYGKINEKTQSYSAHLGIRSKISGGDPHLNLKYDYLATNTVEVIDSEFYQPSYDAKVDGAKEIFSGESTTLTFSANLSDTRYSAYNTSSYAGGTFYIREAPSIQINPDSIQVTSGIKPPAAITRSGEGLDFKVETLKDPEDATIYKVEVPNALIGWHDANGGKLEDVVLSVDVTAKKTRDASDVSLRDVFGFSIQDPVDTESYHASEFTQPDIHNMTGGGLNRMIGAPLPDDRLIVGEDESLYMVTFDGNGADNSEEISSSVVWVNQKGLLYEEFDSFPEPIKQGYKFLGWTLDGDFITENTIIERDVVLRAEWEEVTYTVSFDLQGADESDAFTSFYIHEGAVIMDAAQFPGEAPVKTGHDFVGWELPDGSMLDEQTVAWANAILTAVWRPAITYCTIEFDAGDALNAEYFNGIELSVQKGTAIMNADGYPEEEPYKDGYRFIGWLLLTGEYLNEDTLAESDLRLVAEWEQIPIASLYTVTFDTQGADNAHDFESLAFQLEEGSVIFEAAEFPHEKPEKRGFDFVGWKISEAEWLTPETRITADTVLVAQWEAVIPEYLVTFDSRSADAADEYDSLVLRLEEGSLIMSADGFPENPTKISFTFIGWSLPGGELLTEETPITESVRLVAMWEALYTVTFDTAGADNAELYNKVLILAENSLIVDADGFPEVEPIKEGYTFAGWKLPDGSLLSEDTIISGSMTLTAEWEQILCEVAFDVNGGENASYYSDLKLTLPYGSIVIGSDGFPIDPTRPGHTFAGWRISGGGMLSGETTLVDDIKLVAQWNIVVDPVEPPIDPPVDPPITKEEVVIEASSFNISQNEAGTYVKGKPATHFSTLIDHGSVKAWKKKNNQTIETDITGIDIRPVASNASKFGNGTGTYYVTYYAGIGDQETSLTVLVSVYGR